MRSGRSNLREPPRSEEGFTLIEVSVAAILVVAFALAFATSFGVAFGASRGNLLRQQATGILNEELEYVRALSWDEVAMASVDTSAPMLGDLADTLLGSEVGFDGDEVLVVLTDTGVVTPHRTYGVDGQSYDVYRYVSHSPGGLRRFTVLVTWTGEDNAETLLGSTLVSEVTARGNDGGVGTTLPGSPTTTTVPPTTTTSSSTTTSTTTTTTTTATTTTTTTVPAEPLLVIGQLVLALDDQANQQTATVDIDDETGADVPDATVTGEWSTSPAEPGYPFGFSLVTGGSGRVVFVHNDDHGDGTTVIFCVTNVSKAGYQYDGGVQCVSGVWS